MNGPVLRVMVWIDLLALLTVQLLDGLTVLSLAWRHMDWLLHLFSMNTPVDPVNKFWADADISTQV